MIRNKWNVWITIEVLCAALLLGTVAYQEKQDKEASASVSQPTTIAMLTPTTYLEQKDEPQASSTPTPTLIPTLTPTSTPIPTPTPTLIPTSTLTPTPTLIPTPVKEQADTVQDDMTQDDVAEIEVPEVTPIENSIYATYDTTKHAWWFRRNTTHQKSGSGEAFNIEPFNAYYLDEQATDEEKVFYLTFDCGYENGFTPTILDVLKKYEVPAMFFITEDFLSSHPEYVKRMKEEGHLVGNHTVNHYSMPDMTPEEIQAELTMLEDLMLERTGYEMDAFLRPPMGEYSERTLQVTKDLGYKSIFWSIAYFDYDANNQPGKDYVVQHFSDYHHSGCIALIHNTSKSSTQALEDVILLLKEEGYRLASLKELE